MWKVLRRYQGEPYEPIAPREKSPSDEDPRSSNGQRKGDIFYLNQHTIVQHECRPYAKPQDPSVLSRPFGDLVYDKLVRRMEHEDVSMRRKALAFLLELYGQKQEHVVASLDYNMLAALVKRLSDTDAEVRMEACMALSSVAQQPKGQNLIAQNSTFYLNTFISLLEDENSDVVVESLRLMCSLHAAFNEGLLTQELVAIGCIVKYVEKAKSPDDEICYMALAALNKVFDVKETFVEVLDAGGMEVATDALSSRKDNYALIEACECVSKMAFYSAGKRAAVRCHTSEAVLQHIKHPDVYVRTSATSALVAVTISDAGKLQTIQANAVEELNEVIQGEEERDVLVNLVKVMCNLSEHPAARMQLRSSTLGRLEELLDAGKEHETLVAAITKAISMIRWEPGEPY